MQTATTTTQDDQILFKAETKETVDLKRLIRTVAATVSEAPVTISQDGIHFLSADPAMVAMVDLRLKPEMFTQFNAPESPVQLRINTDELKSRVTEARKGDEVTLAYRHDGYGEYVVDVEIWSNGVTSKFSINASDVEDGDRPETSDLEFTGEAVVSLDKFKDAVGRMGDSADLALYGDRLVIEDDSASVEFTDASDYLFAVDLGDAPVRSTYSTEYLEQVMKLKNTVDHVNLRFGDDFPLQVVADRNKFEVEYTLAPRIEE